MKQHDRIIRDRLYTAAEVISEYSVKGHYCSWLLITAWLTPDDNEVWVRAEPRHTRKPTAKDYPRFIGAERVGSALLKLKSTNSKGQTRGENECYQHTRQWQCLWTEGNNTELDALVTELTGEVNQFESYTTPESRELSRKLSDALNG